MPTSLQYPLERRRDLQRKWGRLLQKTVSPSHACGHADIVPGAGGSLVSSNRSVLRVGTVPPRDCYDDELDDDEEGDEDEADENEPAVIREPDQDE
jgi:hypothetical protein